MFDGTVRKRLPGTVNSGPSLLDLAVERNRLQPDNGFWRSDGDGPVLPGLNSA